MTPGSQHRRLAKGVPARITWPYPEDPERRVVGGWVSNRPAALSVHRVVEREVWWWPRPIRTTLYRVDRPIPYSAELDDGTTLFLEVPEGMITDLTSSPWWARWYAGRSGKHLNAALAHDRSYVGFQDFEGVKPAEWMRRFADDLFEFHMLSLGVRGSKAWVMRKAVRKGGAEWFREREPLADRWA